MALIPYDETIGKKAPTQDTQNVGASKATGFSQQFWQAHKRLTLWATMSS
jgi:hypothetical protein